MRKANIGAALFTDRPVSRNLLLIAAFAACAIVIAVGLDHHTRWLWALVVTVPLAALAVFDLLQTRHSLRRNYPLTARIRWLFEWLRPFLRAYIVEVLRHLSSAGSLQLSLMIFRDGDACPEMNLAAKDNHQRYFLMPLAAFLRDLGVEEAKSVDLARLVGHMATSEWQRRILFGEPPLTDPEMERHAELVVGVLMNGVGIARGRNAAR